MVERDSDFSPLDPEERKEKPPKSENQGKEWLFSPDELPASEDIPMPP